MEGGYRLANERIQACGNAGFHVVNGYHDIYCSVMGFRAQGNRPFALSYVCNPTSMTVRGSVVADALRMGYSGFTV